MCTYEIKITFLLTSVLKLIMMIMMMMMTIMMAYTQNTNGVFTYR